MKQELQKWKKLHEGERSLKQPIMTDWEMKWEDADWTDTYRDMLESFQLIQPNLGKMCDSCSE